MQRTRIGYLTRYSYDELEWAGRSGFDSVQILCWPGNPLDPAQAAPDEIRTAARHLRDLGIAVSAVGCYPNPLDVNAEARQAHGAHLLRLMDLCTSLEAGVLSTFAGRTDPAQPLATSIPAYVEVFTPLARAAEQRGLRIAFENCPAEHLQPGTRGLNIAYCPEGWDLMFAAIDSTALGIEFDPSHAVCLLMDYLDLIRRYGPRIYHVHAKDAEVNWRRVAEGGIADNPDWSRHRTPGHGDVNWPKFYSALVEAGYQGNLDIEGLHDPVFKGERERQGLLFSLNHLRQVVYGQD